MYCILQLDKLCVRPKNIHIKIQHCCLNGITKTTNKSIVTSALMARLKSIKYYNKKKSHSKNITLSMRLHICTDLRGCITSHINVVCNNYVRNST